MFRSFVFVARVRIGSTKTKIEEDCKEKRSEQRTGNANFCQIPLCLGDKDGSILLARIFLKWRYFSLGRRSKVPTTQNLRLILRTTVYAWFLSKHSYSFIGLRCFERRFRDFGSDRRWIATGQSGHGWSGGY